MKKENSKKDLALQEIMKNGYITSWDAFTKHHNTRLSASIYSLRAEGYDIQMKMLTNQKTKSTYGVYYLHDKELKKYEKTLV